MGMAVADALLDRYPRARVVVLEKEDQLGFHASGRNSGVIHAGFYYSPETLKARLTRRGNVLLHAFCEEEGVGLNRCGKLVVAQGGRDLVALDELASRAAANGVPVELVDDLQARDIEPLARTYARALWSPTTSSADPAGVLSALAQRVRRRGGEVHTGTPVLSATPKELVTRSGAIGVGHVVNCAGLQADRVAAQFGMCDDYVVLPFKGLYWHGTWPAGRLRRHVYPVPDPRNPFLGVHLTVTVDGRVKVGPTAIPSLWRESYGGLRRISARDVAEVVRVCPLLLRSRHHDIPGLLRSELPKMSRRIMLAQARRLVPSIRASDFTVLGRPGVRAQLFHLPSRRLEMDFVVRGDEHSTHVLNAVSPAWTSSLAVAEHVVTGVMPAQGW